VVSPEIRQNIVSCNLLLVFGKKDFIVCFFLRKAPFPPKIDGSNDQNIDPWGRCYDHNFLLFLPILGEKNRRFSQKPML
jgi:hypothetical protein